MAPSSPGLADTTKLTDSVHDPGSIPGATTLRDAPARPGEPASSQHEAAGQRAEECLASPACSAAEAARLFVAADDAADPDVDCFRFIDGAGVARDITRARACFEREGKGLECAGSSADLGIAELAMMRIDGIGGRADLPAARGILSPCFDDVTRSEILEHATAKERDPKTPPVDFCSDLGGTTITINACTSRASKNAETKRQLEAKSVFLGLDDAGRDLFSAADRDYGDYAAAMGAFVYEVYIQGTIRGAMSLGEEERLQASLALEDFADLPRFVAKETSARDVAAAQRGSAAALARVATGTAAEKDALAKTQRAWTVYRDAEVAFYVHAFGPKQGTDRVRAALLVRLETRRAKECAAPPAGPE